MKLTFNNEQAQAPQTANGGSYRLLPSGYYPFMVESVKLSIKESRKGTNYIFMESKLLGVGEENRGVILHNNIGMASCLPDGTLIKTKEDNPSPFWYDAQSFLRALGVLKPS
jgi:hypothetical protein